MVLGLGQTIYGEEKQETQTCQRLHDDLPEGRYPYI